MRGVQGVQGVQGVRGGSGGEEHILSGQITNPFNFDAYRFAQGLIFPILELLELLVLLCACQTTG
jgi:hypothetical protein